MPRSKGTKNTPPIIIQEIVEKHKQGVTLRELSQEYNKPYKTIKNMVTRENNKLREKAVHIRTPRGRKPAKTLQEYKYENKRLKMENELLRDFLSLIGRK